MALARYLAYDGQLPDQNKPNYVDAWGLGAMHKAVLWMDTAEVNRLLETGADPNIEVTSPPPCLCLFHHTPPLPSSPLTVADCG